MQEAKAMHACAAAGHVCALWAISHCIEQPAAPMELN